MSMTKKDYTALAAIIKNATIDPSYSGHIRNGFEFGRAAIAGGIAAYCQKENPHGFDLEQFGKNAGVADQAPADIFPSLMLECSTAHMTQRDDQLLMRLCQNPDNAPMLVGYTGVGYFVRLTSLGDLHSEFREECETTGLSTDFIDFCTWAHSQGMATILFDRDAPRIDGQPAFEW